MASELSRVRTIKGKAIKTKVIVNDFTKKYDAKTFEDMYNIHLADLDISILHNNVGMLKTGRFLDISDEDVHNMVTCNTYAPVLLTRQVIQTMIKRNKEKKKRSLVCFTSGMAAMVPVANGAVYSATKILNDFLAWGLEYELSQHNIDVMGWRAGPVKTKLSGHYDGMMSVTPEYYVQCGFSKVTSGVHAGCLSHELCHCMLTNFHDVF